MNMTATIAKERRTITKPGATIAKRGPMVMNICLTLMKVGPTITKIGAAVAKHWPLAIKARRGQSAFPGNVLDTSFPWSINPVPFTMTNRIPVLASIGAW
jgi:hypothetical protein